MVPINHGAGKAARQALKGVLVNPMPWAIVLGAITSAQQVKWPAPVDKTLGLLADAASPVALFTIGAVLARSALRAHSSDSGTVPKSMPLRDYVPIAFIKLLVHPVLVLLVGTTAMQWGVRIEPFALMVVTLVAALPSASNVALLSERFGADTGRIARIILLSTAAAFLTFSGFVALLRELKGPPSRPVGQVRGCWGRKRTHEAATRLNELQMLCGSTSTAQRITERCCER